MSMKNNCRFFGRTTSDIELKHTPSGVEVATFSIAVNEKRSEGEKTVFVDLVAWRGCAKYASKLSKGTQVFVSAVYSPREYTTQHGEKGTRHEFTVEDLFAIRSPHPDTPAPIPTDILSPYSQLPPTAYGLGGPFPPPPAAYGQCPPPAFGQISPTADGGSFESINSDDDLPF